MWISLKNRFRSEYMFESSSVVNKKSVIIWGHACPFEHIVTVLNNSGIMTWCALSDQRFIDHCTFEHDKATRETCQKQIDQLRVHTVEIIMRRIFRYNGAPSNCSNRRKAYLRRKVPDRMIGRSGLLLWPRTLQIRYPTTFWGHTEAKIYNMPIDWTQHMEEKIGTEGNRINETSIRFGTIWGYV